MLCSTPPPPPPLLLLQPHRRGLVGRRPLCCDAAGRPRPPHCVPGHLRRGGRAGAAALIPPAAARGAVRNAGACLQKCHLFKSSGFLAFPPILYSFPFRGTQRVYFGTENPSALARFALCVRAGSVSTGSILLSAPRFEVAQPPRNSAVSSGFSARYLLLGRAQDEGASIRWCVEQSKEWGVFWGAVMWARAWCCSSSVETDATWALVLPFEVTLRAHRCPARAEVDDKLAWRKMKNKESAARSRQLVRDRITFLEDENAGLREACVRELGPPHAGRGALDALSIFSCSIRRLSDRLSKALPAGTADMEISALLGGLAGVASSPTLSACSSALPARRRGGVSSPPASQGTVSPTTVAAHPVSLRAMRNSGGGGAAAFLDDDAAGDYSRGRPAHAGSKRRRASGGAAAPRCLGSGRDSSSFEDEEEDALSVHMLGTSAEAASSTEWEDGGAEEAEAVAEAATTTISGLRDCLDRQSAALAVLAGVATLERASGAAGARLPPTLGARRFPPSASSFFLETHGSCGGFADPPASGRAAFGAHCSGANSCVA